MSDVAVRLEGLGKKYTLRRQSGHKNYTALRDVLMEKLTAPFRPRQQKASDSTEEFWALRDISLEIKHGESVGVIGRNGAGKSTLLKLLSRITHPTEGKITLNGRVASLLEVGTGFHPELTGRENIFLNGAILGMSRAEIKRKFDEIVEFAEVSRFLDTPVKRYSSGMYVRLAFAVAAHLESEILIVDEVLAVGDAQFQRKCLGKMGDLTRGGRTVLFVSHNMAAIEALTQKGIFLKNGSLAFEGSTRDAVSMYFESGGFEPVRDLDCYPARKGSGEARFKAMWLESTNGEMKQVFRPCEEIVLVLTIEVMVQTTLEIGVVIENQKEQNLFCSHASDSLSQADRQYPPGVYQFRMKIAPNHLRCGFYYCTLSIANFGCFSFFDILSHLPLFEINGDSVENEVPLDGRVGDLFYRFNWSLES